VRQVVIKGELRNEVGKGPSRRMRAMGKLPAVVYGKDEETITISLDEREFEKAMQVGLGGGTLIKLVLPKEPGGENLDQIEKTTIIKEVQSDVIRGNIIHVDFQSISLDEAITTRVPIALIGEDARPSDEGIIQHMMWELEVTALPLDIPERIEIDVSEMEIGDSIKVGDIAVSEDIQINTGEEEVIVLITVPGLPEEEEEEVEEEIPEGLEGEPVHEEAAEDHVDDGVHESE